MSATRASNSAHARPSADAFGSAVRNTPNATAEPAAQIDARARVGIARLEAGRRGGSARAASAAPAIASTIPTAWVAPRVSPLARPQATGTIAPVAPIGATTDSGPSSAAL